MEGGGGRMARRQSQISAPTSARGPAPSAGRQRPAKAPHWRVVVSRPMLKKVPRAKRRCIDGNYCKLCDHDAQQGAALPR